MLYALTATALVNTEGSTEDIKAVLDEVTESYPEIMFASAQIETLDDKTDAVVTEALALLKKVEQEAEEYEGYEDDYFDDIPNFGPGNPCPDPDCEYCTGVEAY